MNESKTKSKKMRDGINKPGKVKNKRKKRKERMNEPEKEKERKKSEKILFILRTRKKDNKIGHSKF